MPTDYEKQAADFLSGRGLKFRAVYVDTVPADDSYTRQYGYAEHARYRCTISGKGRGKVSFMFSQSIHSTQNGEEPRAYDLLACIQKYDCGDFENFCGEFGYDTDSRSAHRIWLAVRNEWRKVARFFTPEEIEQLQEIN